MTFVLTIGQLVLRAHFSYKNFFSEIFDALDWLTTRASHIPDQPEQMV